MPFKSIQIPTDYECSITHEIMIEPVFTADGETYERKAISEWLQKHNTSPNTGERLEHTQLVTNRKLKSQISEFVEKNRNKFEQELITASANGDIETIELTIKLGIKCDIQDTQGWTPLHYATYYGQEKVVMLLLSNNCNVEQPTAKISNENRWNYIKSTNISLYKKLESELEKLQIKLNILPFELEFIYNNIRQECQKKCPVSPKEPSSNQTTSYLENSIQAANKKIWELETSSRISNCLLQPFVKSIDPRLSVLGFNTTELPTVKDRIKKIKEEFSRTQLLKQYTVKEGYQQIKDYFIVNRHYQYRHYKTEYEAIAAYCQDMEETCKRFLLPIESCISELEISYKNLEQEKKSFSSPTMSMITTAFAHPLHLAVKQKKENIVKLLIQKGTNLNAKDSNEWTPLHYASSYGCLSILKLLIFNNANIDQKDNGGNTALHLAAQHGDEAILNCLLENGADYKSKNNLNQTPSDIAEICQKKSISDFIVTQGETLLHFKIKSMENTIQAMQKQIEQLNLTNREPNESPYTGVYTGFNAKPVVFSTSPNTQENQKGRIIPSLFNNNK